MAISITIDPSLGYSLISLSLISLACIAIGFIFAHGGRRAVFKKQFMVKYFGAEHQEIFKQQIRNQGYPDTGSGYYSDKLSYEGWYKFNNAQRAHINFVQQISAILIFLFVASIRFSIVAACLGFLIFIGRFAYAIGYTTNGPIGRTIGVIINTLSELGALCLAILSSVYLILQVGS